MTDSDIFSGLDPCLVPKTLHGIGEACSTASGQDTTWGICIKLVVTSLCDRLKSVMGAGDFKCQKTPKILCVTSLHISIGSKQSSQSRSQLHFP